MSDEVERVRAVYAHRADEARERPPYFGFDGPAHVARVHDRLARTLGLLARHGFGSLERLRILDVGCGDGGMLRRFLEWGAAPNALAGIDVRTDAIERGQPLGPALDLRVGSATELPWSDGTFDLVSQHTVFTSILDVEIQRQVAGEMRRVLAPGGAILWYDFRYDNPRNPNVRGVRRHQIEALFPGLVAELELVTLAPPVARRIPASLLPVCYPLLALIPPLRTHYLGLLRRV